MLFLAYHISVYITMSAFKKAIRELIVKKVVPLAGRNMAQGAHVSH